MIVDLVAVAIVLLATSGVPGLFLPRGSPWGQRAATVIVVVGSATGLVAAAMGLAGPDTGAYVFPWLSAGTGLVGVDATSAFFLVPVLLVGGLGSVYGLGYWPQARNPRTARKLQFFWGTMMAGIATLVVARDAPAFLFGWEFMALSAFFLVSTEDDKRECRKAGLVYLMATHVGTLVLFGFFALWKRTSGSFAFQSLPAGTSPLVANALFFMALIGFSLKAGAMPLHFWLPGAHANAPSHVSALMSGILLKMGIYGLVRMLPLLPAPPVAWGGIIMMLGVVSGVLGVVFALAQHDLKRLLAYHSVENIGIILMGLGLAMLGRSQGRPEWVLLGMGGCLLHIWNHALFKSLLFMGAGSVLHATRTRQIDCLGGLAKPMPRTAALFLVGAVAICGLPPLNGFVSEFLVYAGLFRGAVTAGYGGIMTLAVAPALALVGALAVACFVKVYGAVFLGSARSGAATAAHESPVAMTIPMGVLAAACLCIGLAPGLFAPLLDRAAAPWMASTDGGAVPRLAELVPLGAVGGFAMAVAAAVAGAVLIARIRAVRGRAVVTWDCGYAAPGPRMQYTASSFAEALVSLFRWVLRPRVHEPQIPGAFPQESSMGSHVDEPVLDRAIVPAFVSMRKGLGWFGRFQQGQTQGYILYVLVALAMLLATLVPFGDIVKSLFTRS